MLRLSFESHIAIKPAHLISLYHTYLEDENGDWLAPFVKNKIAAQIITTNQLLHIVAQLNWGICGFLVGVYHICRREQITKS